MPVIEAMSNACPVICSNVSALPEVGGSAALYFSPEDEAHLKKHLLAVCKQNYKSENAEKLKLQAQQFSWQKTAEQTFYYLENLKQ